MRNLQRSLSILGGFAGASLMASALIVGCSGDDVNPADGGKDSATDTSVADTGADAPDSGLTDGPPGADGGNMYLKFRTDVAAAICTRTQACCGQIDAGNFDYSRCVKGFTETGWGTTNEGLNVTGVVDRGHLKLDQTSVNACLAALSTISCPVITSSEYKNITANCQAAIVGTQTTGGECVASIECQPTDYCYLETDAGLTEAGVPLGKCATLLDAGVKCGQGHYGEPYFSSDECAYKSGPTQARFCNYDSWPTTSGYFCGPTRAANQLCYFNNECQSGICSVPNATGIFDCQNGNCVCNTSVNFGGYVCEAFKPLPKDAGTD